MFHVVSVFEVDRSADPPLYSGRHWYSKLILEARGGRRLGSNPRLQVSRRRISQFETPGQLGAPPCGSSPHNAITKKPARNEVRADANCASGCARRLFQGPAGRRGPHGLDELHHHPGPKKNPLMSMWLSVANKSVGGATGQATSAARRAVALAQADAARQVLAFWGVKPSKAAPRKKSRR